MKIQRALLIISFVVFCFAPIYELLAQKRSDDIVGLWFNEEKTGKIQVTEKDNRYFGTLTWVKIEPGDNGLDDENPDPKLRTKPLVGLNILKNFKFEDGEYTDGTIYDPKNGKTYSCIMKLESMDKLYVRGYIGFSLIGRTTYWTRIE